MRVRNRNISREREREREREEMKSKKGREKKKSRREKEKEEESRREKEIESVKKRQRQADRQRTLMLVARLDCKRKPYQIDICERDSGRLSQPDLTPSFDVFCRHLVVLVDSIFSQRHNSRQPQLELTYFLSVPIATPFTKCQRWSRFMISSCLSSFRSFE